MGCGHESFIRAVAIRAEKKTEIHRRTQENTGTRRKIHYVKEQNQTDAGKLMSIEQQKNNIGEQK